MRDDQVRRYARHIALAEIGGLGQTALLVSRVRVRLREPEPLAELVAATYLAAGGVGTLVLENATAAQRADVAAHGPDTNVVDRGEAPELALAPRPAWWPSAEGDDVALAFWRGGIAATTWLGTTATR